MKKHPVHISAVTVATHALMGHAHLNHIVSSSPRIYHHAKNNTPSDYSIRYFRLPTERATLCQEQGMGIFRESPLTIPPKVLDYER